MGIFSPAGPGITQTTELTDKSSLTITSLTVGTVETSWVIPAGTRSVMAKVSKDSGASLLYLASGVGNTTTDNKFTIYPEGQFWEENLVLDSPLTLYVKASKTNTVIEIKYWS